MRDRYVVYVAAMLALAAAAAVRADLVGGRPMDERVPSSFSFKIGQITSIDADVRETKRAYTDVTGVQAGYGALLEDYSLDELGFDESYLSLGIAFESQWKYLTLQIDMSYLSPSADAVARRDYYIQVGEISHEGEEYDYMVIPEGESFDTDMQGGIFAIKALITPFTITGGDTVFLTPWIHLGVFSIFGHYEIDAGPSQGVVEYEYPPEEYVVGGKGEGWAGIAIPEIGFGGEMVLKLGRVESGPVHLVLQGDVGLMSYSGSTSDLGASARHDKDLDLTWINYELKAQLEIPMSPDSDFIIGVSFQHAEADAALEAMDKSPEQQGIDREKYDKDVDFELNVIHLHLGFKF